MNDGVALRRILRYLELGPKRQHAIDTLAHDFGIRRRSLYDFISIFCVFGICRRDANGSVEWVAMNCSIQIVNTLRCEAEREAPNSEIKEVFNAALDSSIQRIARSLVKLFFYLRVKFLDLRQVSRLFAQWNTKYKTMLRKVYTIATSLEILGIVKKTNVVAEIQLIVPLDSEIREPTLNVQGLLNTYDQISHEKVCDRRRRQFIIVCAELSEPHRVSQIPRKITTIYPSLPQLASL
jgi:hypothetical protein